MNEESIMSRYSDVVLPDVETIRSHAKDAAFSDMCDFPDKNIKLTKWPYVLNCCSECPDVFVSDAEVNSEEYSGLLFIHFCHYKTISYCYVNKHIFPDHGKTYPLWMNLESVDKGNVTTRKIPVLKSCSILDFRSEYYNPSIEKMAFRFPHFTYLG